MDGAVVRGGDGALAAAGGGDGVDDGVVAGWMAHRHAGLAAAAAGGWRRGSGV